MRGVIRAKGADRGVMHINRSADPDFDVEARLPCFPICSSVDARIDDVVEMLKVLCESPPVPTMSH